MHKQSCLSQAKIATMWWFSVFEVFSLNCTCNLSDYLKLLPCDLSLACSIAALQPVKAIQKGCAALKPVKAFIMVKCVFVTVVSLHVLAQKFFGCEMRLMCIIAAL